MTAVLFRLGRSVATAGALSLLAATATEPAQLLRCHAAGDWGEVPSEYAHEKDLSISEGFRVLNSYPVGTSGEKVWIITEAVRASISILLPREY